MSIVDSGNWNSYYRLMIKFRHEDDAGRAMEDLNNRFYGGRPIYAELSPVTDFREACCKQYENDECSRGNNIHLIFYFSETLVYAYSLGGFCNFMHIKQPNLDLKRRLFAGQRAEKMLRRQEREERKKRRSNHD